MTTLTNRYIAAVLRDIPAKQRADIDRELQALIADTMESRSETDALASLGDPTLLAAEYSGRPLYLIGPSHFSDYRRILASVLATALPLLFVVFGILQIAGGDGFSAALWGATYGVATVAIQIFFWTTVVFASIERFHTRPSKRSARSVWTPASLSQLPDRRVDRGSIIGGTAVVTIIAGALIVIQTLGPVRNGSGTVIGMIEPSAWNSGVLLLIVFFAAASIALDILGFYVGWGQPQAFAGLVLSLLFVGGALGLLWSGRLLNGPFFEAIGWPSGAGPFGVVTVGIAVTVVLLSLTYVVDCFRRSRVSAHSSSSTENPEGRDKVMRQFQ